jgi:hypothetical protein
MTSSLVAAAENVLTKFGELEANTGRILQSIGGAEPQGEENESSKEIGNEGITYVSSAGAYNQSSPGISQIAGRVKSIGSAAAEALWGLAVGAHVWGANGTAYAKGGNSATAIGNELDIGYLPVSLETANQEQNLTEGGKLKLVSVTDQEGFTAPTEHGEALIGGKGGHLVTYEGVSGNELTGVKGYVGKVSANTAMNVWSSTWDAYALVINQSKPEATNEKAIVAVAQIGVNKAVDGFYFLGPMKLEGSGSSSLLHVGSGVEGPFGLNLAAGSFATAGLALGKNKLTGEEVIGAESLAKEAITFPKLSTNVVERFDYTASQKGFYATPRGLPSDANVTIR